MKLLYELEPGARMPERSHSCDAGLDLFALHDVILHSDSTAKVSTGVHVLIPEGYCGLVFPRSSVSNRSMCIPVGVIDAGYTGPIYVNIHALDLGPEILKAGAKIAQLVVVPIPDLELVPGAVSAVHTERGDCGFGSSGG